MSPIVNRRIMNGRSKRSARATRASYVAYSDDVPTSPLVLQTNNMQHHQYSHHGPPPAMYQYQQPQPAPVYMAPPYTAPRSRRSLSPDLAEQRKQARRQHTSPYKATPEERTKWSLILDERKRMDGAPSKNRAKNSSQVYLSDQNLLPLAGMLDAEDLLRLLGTKSHHAEQLKREKRLWANRMSADTSRRRSRQQMVNLQCEVDEKAFYIDELEQERDELVELLESRHPDFGRYMREAAGMREEILQLRDDLANARSCQPRFGSPHSSTSSDDTITASSPETPLYPTPVDHSFKRERSPTMSMAGPASFLPTPSSSPTYSMYDLGHRFQGCSMDNPSQQMQLSHDDDPMYDDYLDARQTYVAPSELHTIAEGPEDDDASQWMAAEDCFGEEGLDGMAASMAMVHSWNQNGC